VSDPGFLYTPLIDPAAPIVWTDLGAPDDNPCPRCDGSGRQDCPDCYGWGHLAGEDVPCLNCDSTGIETCEKCDGTGKAT
jgi:DnaJ-class molecular chaperone